MLKERTGKRILAVPLIRDNIKRCNYLQELTKYRKEFAGIKIESFCKPVMAEKTCTPIRNKS